MMDSPTRTMPPGHVIAPAITISALSFLLVAGLHFLGLLEKANTELADALSKRIHTVFPQALPPLGIWLATLALVLGLTFTLLCVPRAWQRTILWITSLVIIAGWAPVLGLAAHKPEIAAPWIAALWSGMCAMAYAGNHRMPCDDSPQPAS
jgi:Mg2+/citrate symporter